MKKIVVILFVLFSLTGFAQEKLGLMIIAHGSPAKQWNQPVLDLENQVKQLFDEKKITKFNEVRVALMEFTEPSIASVIKDFEDKGITKVFALPVFIAPSGHSIYDIPTILGLYFDKEMIDELKEEGIKIVDSKINITVGPSLDYENIMKDILLDKVKNLSDNPEEEALIILAHGDKNFMPIWEKLSNETGNYILGKTGIEYFDKAFVEVGQSFSIDGVSPILKAFENKKKVIVVGMYLSMGVKNMAENSGFIMMGRTIESKKMFEGKNIVFAEHGLLPDKRIAEWIVDRAVEWLGI
ncbi:MAG: sirohydrochlorin cobaltochelatase [Bacteroidales bacterium]|jgi:cobalamin biosynthesis Co2+ chelatase CbiK|nr:sirohydrochlorin cobaltochelatase [Bacteroidales bacterium]